MNKITKALLITTTTGVAAAGTAVGIVESKQLDFSRKISIKLHNDELIKNSNNSTIHGSVNFINYSPKIVDEEDNYILKSHSLNDLSTMFRFNFFSDLSFVITPIGWEQIKEVSYQDFYVYDVVNDVSSDNFAINITNGNIKYTCSNSLNYANTSLSVIIKLSSADDVDFTHLELPIYDGLKFEKSLIGKNSADLIVRWVNKNAQPPGVNVNVKCDDAIVKVYIPISEGVAPHLTASISSPTVVQNHTINSSISLDDHFDVTLPTSGNKGISGLPNGIIANWQPDNTIALTGKAHDKIDAYSITIELTADDVDQTLLQTSVTLCIVPNSYIEAYCDSSLEVGVSVKNVNIHLNAVGVTLPTSGNEGITGLPDGVIGTWDKNDIIVLSGTPKVADTSIVTISVGDGDDKVSTQTSITVRPEPDPYIESYCDTSLKVGQECEAKIHLSSVGVTVPTSGDVTLQQVSGLPVGVKGKWDKEGSHNVIVLNGHPESAGTYIVIITLKDVNNNDVQTATSVTVLPRPTAYMEAYCDSSLEVGVAANANIHVTTVGVDLPTSGNDGISGLPNGINGTWDNNGLIILSGTPTTQGTYTITIELKDVEGKDVLTQTSVTVRSQASQYIEAYCVGALQVETKPTAKIHVKAVGVTLPTSGSSGISNLPNGVTAEWEVNGIISLSGSPTTSGTKIVNITVQNVSTQTSVTVLPRPTSYISAYCDSSLEVGVAANANIHVTAVGVTLPTSGSDGISNLPNGVTGTWKANGIIALTGTPTAAGTTTATIAVGGVSTKTSITVRPQPTAYICAYCDASLHVGVAATAKVHVTAVGVTLPTSGNSGISFPSNGTLAANWQANGIIQFSGTPKNGGTFIFTITLNGLTAQTSFTVTEDTFPIVNYTKSYSQVYSTGLQVTTDPITVTGFSQSQLLYSFVWLKDGVEQTDIINGTFADDGAFTYKAKPGDHSVLVIVKTTDGSFVYPCQIDFHITTN